MDYIGNAASQDSDVRAVDRVLNDLKRQALADPHQRDQYRSLIADRLVKEAQIRSRIFDPLGHIFCDPAWTLLVAIYSATAHQKRLSVSDAANASCAPPTTALRHLTTLINAGLVEREADFHDRRKSFVALTERGMSMMYEYFDQAATV